MNNLHLHILTFLLLLFSSCYGQNLPSLIHERNINSTFSILAYDAEAAEWGIAVATNNIYVGNSTIYIEPGVGAFSVIAETNPAYGIEGLKKLKSRKSIEEAISEVRAMDESAHYRQVSGIDAQGNVFAFTGQSLKYWNGVSSEIIGQHYVVMGNQLAKETLAEMSRVFEASKGSLAQRLLASLAAGQKAGGQISGKQSAAVVVKGMNNEWFNQIDLRVDNSKRPIQELQVLMNYHYGRIRLNQALYAHRASNTDRARQKLAEAEVMLEGWTGIYSKIAMANYLIKDADSAVKWIKKGLAENSNWSVYLPAFYFLKDHPELQSIIQPDAFSMRDWESALGMFSNLGRELKLIELAKQLIDKNIESSYLYFLLGRAYFFEKEDSKAVEFLEKALNMDSDNIEAQQLLSKIKTE